MKHNGALLKFSVNMLIVFFLITTPILTSCGGGGGASEVSPTGDPTTIPDVSSGSVPDLLDSQNTKAEEYVSKLEQLMESDALVEEKLLEHDPTDIASIDEIISEAEESYTLAQEIEIIGEEIIELEKRIQGDMSSSINSTGLVSIERPIVPFDGGLTLGICLAAVSGVAVGISNYYNLKDAYWDLQECLKTYRRDADREQFEICKQNVESKLYWKYYTTLGGGFLSVIIPEAVGKFSRIGSVALSSASTANDVDTLIAQGERIVDSANRNIFQALNDEDAQPTHFISRSNEDGTIPVPEGQWSVTVFTPGQARFGTPKYQPITVQKDETTFVDYSTISTNDATSSDFQTCDSINDPVEDREEYLVWYMDNVRCWNAPRVYATDRDRFNLEEDTCNIPGGGINCDVKVEKVEMQGGFTTLEAAQDWFCPQITTEWFHYHCNDRGSRVETGSGLYQLQIPCDLTDVPYQYP